MRANQLPSKESRLNLTYNKALKRPVDDTAFLLEAGQGRNVNGNVFALLRYIRSTSKYDGHTVSLALIPEKQEEAKLKFKKYGISDVRIVDFGADDYLQALATSKYLITDNSFPAYFYKRLDQIYLNTWHGTPLKILGRQDIKNAVSIGNVQANMAKADWLLFPNSFTKATMMKDYMMEHIFKHRAVIMDYPRNDALYKAEFREEIEDKYGLKGKKLIAYMPTWRGTGRDIDADEQAAQTKKIIEDIDDILTDSEVLAVNFHFLIDWDLDESSYRHVMRFPAEYETYDFLAVCDTLITDYSSVSIDFAGTGKDIVLYLYDYDQYKKDKGFYIDVKELPFKKAYSLTELDECIHESHKDYSLREDLSCTEKGNSAKKTIELICENKASRSDIEDYSACNESDEHPNFVYFDNINRDDSKAIISDMQKSDGSKPVIVFANTMTEKTVETLESIVDDLDFIKISGRFYCNNSEFRLLRLHNKYGIFKKTASKVYKREAERQILQFAAKRLDVAQCGNADRKHMLKYAKEIIESSL